MLGHTVCLSLDLFIHSFIHFYTVPSSHIHSPRAWLLALPQNLWTWSLLPGGLALRTDFKQTASQPTVSGAGDWARASREPGEKDCGPGRGTVQPEAPREEGMVDPVQGQDWPETTQKISYLPSSAPKLMSTRQKQAGFFSGHPDVPRASGCNA